MDKIQSKVGSSFSREIINYSMVWEDPSLLIEAAPQKENLNILSISSAGDNALSLLSMPGAKVSAVDMSEPQNNLLKLKKTAISHISHSEYLTLFGYKEETESSRLQIYDRIKYGLDPISRKYWDAHQDLIKSGIIHSGRLESYFNKFQENGINNLFSKQELALLLTNDNLFVQQKFIQEKTPQLEEFISSFFNKKSFSEEGRSEAQYKYVEKNVSIESHLIKRTFQALQKHLISENSYLHYIFAKSFSDNNLPDHLQPKNFERIQKNINNLNIVTSDLETLISHQSQNFDFFNLSDVFEYVSEKHFEQMLTLFYKKSSTQAKLCYWNLFVDRLPSSASSWTHNKSLSESLHKKDRVWFYKNFNVLEKN